MFSYWLFRSFSLSFSPMACFFHLFLMLNVFVTDNTVFDLRTGWKKNREKNQTPNKITYFERKRGQNVSIKWIVYERILSKIYWGLGIWNTEWKYHYKMITAPTTTEIAYYLFAGLNFVSNERIYIFLLFWVKIEIDLPSWRFWVQKLKRWTSNIIHMCATIHSIKLSLNRSHQMYKADKIQI